MFKIPNTDIVVEDGQSVVLIGPACSGKSAIASRIASFYPSTAKYIAFQDSYGYASDRAYYLQQRWNSTEFDEDAPTGDEILNRLAVTDADRERLQELIDLFGIAKILKKDPITFSSGELRKYQLVKSLLKRPSILVIDNPFIGLDPKTRMMLAKLLEGLSRELSLVLVLSRPEEIPPFITHAIVCTQSGGNTNAATVQNVAGGGTDAEKGQSATGGGTDAEKGQSATGGGTDAEKGQNATCESRCHRGGTGNQPVKLPLGDYLDGIFGPEVISFNNVSVRYGDRTILKDLNWTVRRGEHWALTGENGCGKSTLLSLVCADNPMGYACDIRLFGKKRGSGESIWEIKKRIGYVSPEMHRAYRATQCARDIVTSGFYDTTALMAHPTQQQKEKVAQWMKIFGIEELGDVVFSKLSGTQQRLVLVCRAFVKEPELLILDEPLHGLDNPSRFKVRGIIDDYCKGGLATEKNENSTYANTADGIKTANGANVAYNANVADGANGANAANGAIVANGANAADNARAKAASRTLIMVTHYPEEYPSCIDHSLTLIKN